MNEVNRAVFDREADTYVDLALKPAERQVLSLLEDRLAEMDMLDLGVGTGRTGHTFAPLVHRYVGLDYSPRMLERAGKLIGERENVELVLGDARDLSGLGKTFDFVLFSFNGIDAVAHEDRLKILGEVRRVLRPDGYFLFSAHSLGALPLDTRKARSPRFRRFPPYEAYARLTDIPYGKRVRKINRSLDLDTARSRGWTTVKRGHNFQIDDYYVDPVYQVEQLSKVGLKVSVVYNVDGEEVELPYVGRDPWLDYLCRPSGAET
jgi:ubiquinone/menaquinone biosynthesis C-methylase UbiE